MPGFCLWVLESGAQDFTLTKQACHPPLRILHSSFVYGANIQTPSFQLFDALRPLLLSAVTFLVGSKGRKGLRTLTYFLCSFQNFSLVVSKDERILLFAEQRIPSQTWRASGHLMDLETQSHEEEQLFTLNAYYLLP